MAEVYRRVARLDRRIPRFACRLPPKKTTVMDSASRVSLALLCCDGKKATALGPQLVRGAEPSVARGLERATPVAHSGRYRTTQWWNRSESRPMDSDSRSSPCAWSSRPLNIKTEGSTRGAKLSVSISGGNCPGPSPRQRPRACVIHERHGILRRSPAVSGRTRSSPLDILSSMALWLLATCGLI